MPTRLRKDYSKPIFRDWPSLRSQRQSSESSIQSFVSYDILHSEDIFNSPRPSLNTQNLPLKGSLLKMSAAVSEIPEALYGSPSSPLRRKKARRRLSAARANHQFNKTHNPLRRRSSSISNSRSGKSNSRRRSSGIPSVNEKYSKAAKENPKVRETNGDSKSSSPKIMGLLPNLSNTVQIGPWMESRSVNEQQDFDTGREGNDEDGYESIVDFSDYTTSPDLNLPSQFEHRKTIFDLSYEDSVKSSPSIHVRFQNESDGKDQTLSSPDLNHSSYVNSDQDEIASHIGESTQFSPIVWRFSENSFGGQQSTTSANTSQNVSRRMSTNSNVGNYGIDAINQGQQGMVQIPRKQSVASSMYDGSCDASRRGSLLQQIGLDSDVKNGLQIYFPGEGFNDKYHLQNTTKIQEASPSYANSSDWSKGDNSRKMSLASSNYSLNNRRDSEFKSERLISTPPIGVNYQELLLDDYKQDFGVVQENMEDTSASPRTNYSRSSSVNQTKYQPDEQDMQDLNEPKIQSDSIADFTNYDLRKASDSKSTSMERSLFDNHESIDKENETDTVPDTLSGQNQINNLHQFDFDTSKSKKPTNTNNRASIISPFDQPSSKSNTGKSKKLNFGDDLTLLNLPLLQSLGNMVQQEINDITRKSGENYGDNPICSASDIEVHIADNKANGGTNEESSAQFGYSPNTLDENSIARADDCSSNVVLTQNFKRRESNIQKDISKSQNTQLKPLKSAMKKNSNTQASNLLTQSDRRLSVNSKGASLGIENTSPKVKAARRLSNSPSSAKSRRSNESNRSAMSVKSTSPIKHIEELNNNEKSLHHQIHTDNVTHTASLNSSNHINPNANELSELISTQLPKKPNLQRSYSTLTKRDLVHSKMAGGTENDEHPNAISLQDYYKKSYSPVPRSSDFEKPKRQRMKSWVEIPTYIRDSLASLSSSDQKAKQKVVTPPFVPVMNGTSTEVPIDIDETKRLELRRATPTRSVSRGKSSSAERSPNSRNSKESVSRGPINEKPGSNQVDNERGRSLSRDPPTELAVDNSDTSQSPLGTPRQSATFSRSEYFNDSQLDYSKEVQNYAQQPKDNNNYRSNGRNSVQRHNFALTNNQYDQFAGSQINEVVVKRKKSMMKKLKFWKNDKEELEKESIESPARLSRRTRSFRRGGHF